MRKRSVAEDEVLSVRTRSQKGSLGSSLSLPPAQSVAQASSASASPLEGARRLRHVLHRNASRTCSPRLFYSRIHGPQTRSAVGTGRRKRKSETDSADRAQTDMPTTTASGAAAEPTVVFDQESARAVVSAGGSDPHAVPGTTAASPSSDQQYLAAFAAPAQVPCCTASHRFAPCHAA
jgi:hypothetical protein